MSEGLNTLAELVKAQATLSPAILSPGRPPLRYGALYSVMMRVRTSLRAVGIGKADRVAIVMPDSAETAVTFLAVASAATAAPLNPAYKREEFSYYLSDLRVKALIVADGDETVAREAARALSIPVLTVHSDGDGVPAIELGSVAKARAVADEDTCATDPALLLHTSGTTSKPKIVPLTQLNLTTSARNIATTLALSPADRGLLIMPLFHIHGLMGALLSAIASGGSVFCGTGFNALKVFGWLDEADPTWYSAVPTMHQAILGRAARNSEIVATSRLRFIRSSSAPTPPTVIRELEHTFRCPVIESYGMTEASHQMASNPLPPAVRKPGTVGLAAGPDVAIMGEGGQLLPAGAVGEIVIAGANVTAGYENRPEANAEAFHNGWFRTGDLGVIDDEGYLTISGRLKEIINRGGEKISPREVDDILTEHPAVEQALTFGVPSSRLGEEVGAAVVLREGAALTEAEIRNYAAERLAAFKVPRHVVFLEEIPKGPTGKLQRIGLADKLGMGER
ncbi:acyl--CoA ligase [Ensifer adhaerens]|uniref:acyl--CoA ligase n=1 Tax=Ensifer adhaerens TaxID=106592 RepID=UPI000FDCDD35|nr:acyl--CoA ligase [Ensifer adhaerens]MDF8357552.1 acyl--CoA ligase [Ensifer adhaerens]THA61020.1 AMP-dependent synthetase [Ensifer adhaerens]